MDMLTKSVDQDNTKHSISTGTVMYVWTKNDPQEQKDSAFGKYMSELVMKIWVHELWKYMSAWIIRHSKNTCERAKYIRSFTLILLKKKQCRFRSVDSQPISH